MNLPGWVLMLLGVGVIAYSKFVEARNDSNLIFFVIAGGVIVAYGLMKEIAKRMRKPKKEKNTAARPHQEEARTDHRHPAGHHYHGKSHHEQHTHVKPHKHHHHPHKPAHKRCPSCHADTVHDAGFCHRCGHRF